MLGTRGQKAAPSSEWKIPVLSMRAKRNGSAILIGLLCEGRHRQIPDASRNAGGLGKRIQWLQAGHTGYYGMPRSAPSHQANPLSSPQPSRKYIRHLPFCKAFQISSALSLLLQNQYQASRPVKKVLPSGVARSQK